MHLAIITPADGKSCRYSMPCNDTLSFCFPLKIAARPEVEYPSLTQAPSAFPALPFPAHFHGTGAKEYLQRAQRDALFKGIPSAFRGGRLDLSWVNSTRHRTQDTIRQDVRHQKIHFENKHKTHKKITDKKHFFVIMTHEWQKHWGRKRG